jgi:hypothetical protein
MTNQHQATPDEWAQQEDWANRSVFSDSSCIIELRDRVAALESAPIKAKAAEAGAQCAVEQIRSKPGSWQSLKVDTEIIYGDAHAAAKQILRAPLVVEGTFEHSGETYRFKAKPERETAVDELRAASADAQPTGSLVDRIATDAELCQVYNEKTTLRAVYDLGREHGAAPIRSGPESPLVERVADAIAAQATSAGIVNDRAASALAKPEPVAPTDEALKAAYWEAFKNSAACGAEESWLAGLRSVASYGTPTIQPVPVSERLPGPEDCEAGECWAWDTAAESWNRTHYALCNHFTHFTHWLPHHALPTPEAQ